MQLDLTSQINFSKSKVVNKFGNDTRFKPIKLINQKVSYNKTTDFERIVRD